VPNRRLNMEHMNLIPVICKNNTYWKAYIQDYLRHSDVKKIGPNGYLSNGSLFFPVFTDSMDSSDKLRGLRIERAIIYQCFPGSRLWDVLLSRFGENRINIDTITRY